MRQLKMLGGRRMIVRLQQWHETWYLIVVSKVYEAAFQMIVRFIGCCLMVISLAIPALAKQRHALLIGNEAYAPEVGRLKNPANDVRLIAASLQQVGFAEKNITVVTNADRAAVLEAVEEYADRLANAGKDAVGFFYYSGHGAANQRDKSNYLIPVGVKRLDSRVWYKAIALNRVISRLSNIASNAAHFVVFDACRNILKSPTRGTKGFVPVSERRGMLIAFSTDPGETATDEGEGSGPYAAALAKELVRRGQHHLDVFQNVKEAVYQKTKTQVPWTRDGMLQRVYLAGTQRQLLAEQESRARSRIDLAYWDAVKDRQDPVLFRQYIKRFPTGTFVDLARQLAERLEKAEQTKLTSLQREAELRLAEERRQRAEISKQLAEQREADAKKAQELERARQQAEKARAALKAAETKRLAAENAVKQAEAARLGSERQIAALRKEQLQIEQQQQNQPATSVAGTTPVPVPTAPAVSLEIMAFRVQSELKRLGCYNGTIDGKWGPQSRDALARAGTALKVNYAAEPPTGEVLKKLQQRTTRLCLQQTTPANATANKPTTNDRKKTTKGGKRTATKKKCMSYSACMKRCLEQHGGGCAIHCAGGGSTPADYVCGN